MICSCSDPGRGRDSTITVMGELVGATAAASIILALDGLQQDVLHGLSASVAALVDGSGIGHLCGQLW